MGLINENDPQTVEEVKKNVTCAIKKISTSTLLSVSKEMKKRARLCSDQNSDPFEHLLWMDKWISG